MWAGCMIIFTIEKEKSVLHDREMTEGDGSFGSAIGHLSLRLRYRVDKKS